MSDDDQRIEIAKAHFGADNYRVKLIAHPRPCHYQWYDAEGNQVNTPEYTSCLNAIHAAEKTLTEEQLNEYGAYLNSAASDGVSLQCPEHSEIACVAMSTAARRAEAFLKAIGKWTES